MGRPLSNLVMAAALMMAGGSRAWGGVELQVNKSTYSSGEPIILRPSFYNDTGERVEYSPGNNVEVVIFLYRINPQPVGGFETFEIEHNGTVVQNVITIYHYHPHAEGIIQGGDVAPFKRAAAFTDATTLVWGFDLLRGQAATSGGVTYYQLQSGVSKTLEPGDIIKVLTPGTYRLELGIKGLLQINDVPLDPAEYLTDSIYININR